MQLKATSILITSICALLANADLLDDVDLTRLTERQREGVSKVLAFFFQPGRFPLTFQAQAQFATMLGHFETDLEATRRALFLRGGLSAEEAVAVCNNFKEVKDDWDLIDIALGTKIPSNGEISKETLDHILGVRSELSGIQKFLNSGGRVCKVDATVNTPTSSAI